MAEFFQQHYLGCDMVKSMFKTDCGIGRRTGSPGSSRLKDHRSEEDKEKSVTLGGRRKSGTFHQDEEVKCEVQMESEQRSEASADKWSGLGFSSCAAPFPTPKARFQEVTD
ncbi:hypothetical protein B0H10DRAFT_1948561 [Mycena sp. CBHHK59/15]|nr:hypothetical protein B0H10DRAFT_1948561 [Mycena sp. CBHHK59/15]